jgi:hypothetical protein
VPTNPYTNTGCELHKSIGRSNQCGAVGSNSEGLHGSMRGAAGRGGNGSGVEAADVVLCESGGVKGIFGTLALFHNRGLSNLRLWNNQ